jgi:glycosyltransferase involved in cell wall biosynthesis
MQKNKTPIVSVITPTYNRRRFIPFLIKAYEQQTYPHAHMEWIILDDGQDKVKDLFDEAAKRIPNIRYMALPEDEKLLIGAKRNILNDEAKGSIIVAMDDDDYYVPTRVESVVAAFKRYPQVELAGASEIYMYYTDIQTIYKLGPYNANHATNGTMAWRSSYAKKHRYDEIVTHSEERSFLDDYSHQMIQLDPKNVMLVISHSENTFDKKAMREKENPFMKKMTQKINEWIQNSELRDFYATA